MNCRILLPIICAAFVGLITSDVRAQNFAVEQFEPPHAQGTNNLNLGKSEVLRAWTPSFGLFGHYVNDPLTLSLNGEEQGAIIGSQVKTELWAAIGLFDYADLGIVMPLVVWQDGDEFAGSAVEGFATGDLRVVPKAQFLKPGTLGGLGVGLLATVWVPTGDTDSYNSDGSVRVEPRLLVDYTVGEFVILTNVGFQFRDTTNQRNFTSGNTVRWGAGIEAPLGLDGLKGLANVFGAVGLEDARDPNQFSDAVSSQSTPVEADLAIQYELPWHLIAQAGGGFGLTSSVGSPDFRVLASIGYTPRVADSDGDGIPDKDDACPDEPEDKDGFEDSDGCPDLDNDNDGIPDADDACPNEPEDMDGFEDEDGCPDPDNDGDGILDINDACPDEPETINGFEDEDGCPDEGETKVKVTDKKIEILEKVFFDTNKAKIKDRSFNVLQQVAAVLKNNAQITKIRVEGHTDSRGADSYNLELSQQRAESVRDFLVQSGVSADRLVAVGYGEEKPIDTNETSEGRERNRRVEFLIIEVNGKPAGDAGDSGVQDTTN